MKYKILLFFSCLLTICLNTSCNKAKLTHSISAHTWVVTEVSHPFYFAKIGDEFTFYDNRLLFKNSNGFESDGRWDLTERGTVSSPNVDALFIYSDFGEHDFSIVNWTEDELELYEPYVQNPNTLSVIRGLTLRLEPKK